MSSPRHFNDGEALPPIRTSYQESYGFGKQQQNSLTPRELQMQVQTISSRDALILDERLRHQEHTTANLLDRAFKIKEDIIDSLNFTRGTWQEEKHAREMLQEHIRTITAVVRKLNSDIEGLNGQLQNRDVSLQGASDAMKNLEMHHVAGVTDLRGRVARADGAISKLSTDFHTLRDLLSSQEGRQSDTVSKVVDRCSTLETRLAENLGQIERQMGQHATQAKHRESDMSRQVQQLEQKVVVNVDELKSALTSLIRTHEVERDRQEQKFTSHLEKAFAQMDSRLEKMEKRFNDRNTETGFRVDRIERDIASERETTHNLINNLEAKTRDVLDEGLRRQMDETERLKRECREGFSAVQETIGNMKSVLDGRVKLIEEQLRKEINQIRKMVVLI